MQLSAETQSKSVNKAGAQGQGNVAEAVDDKTHAVPARQMPICGWWVVKPCSAVATEQGKQGFRLSLAKTPAKHAARDTSLLSLPT